MTKMKRRKAVWYKAVLARCNVGCRAARTRYAARIARATIRCRHKAPAKKKGCLAWLAKKRKVWQRIMTRTCKNKVWLKTGGLFCCRQLTWCCCIYRAPRPSPRGRGRRRVRRLSSASVNATPRRVSELKCVPNAHVWHSCGAKRAPGQREPPKGYDAARSS